MDNLDTLKANMISDQFAGRSLKNFTVVEDELREVGKCMDELSGDIDNVNTLEIASTMLVKLMAMKQLLDDYIKDTQNSIDQLEAIVGDINGQ